MPLGSVRDRRVRVGVERVRGEALEQRDRLGIRCLGSSDPRGPSRQF